MDGKDKESQHTSACSKAWDGIDLVCERGGMACAEVQLAHANMMMLKIHSACIDGANYYSGAQAKGA
jgi:hypothetical protein